MIKLGPSTRKNKKYMAMLENGKDNPFRGQ